MCFGSHTAHTRIRRCVWWQSETIFDCAPHAPPPSDYTNSINYTFSLSLSFSGALELWISARLLPFQMRIICIYADARHKIHVRRRFLVAAAAWEIWNRRKVIRPQTNRRGGEKITINCAYRTICCVFLWICLTFVWPHDLVQEKEVKKKAMRIISVSPQILFIVQSTHSHFTSLEWHYNKINMNFYNNINTKHIFNRIILSLQIMTNNADVRYALHKLQSICLCVAVRLIYVMYN